MPRSKKPPGTAADPRNGRRLELALTEGDRLVRFDLPRHVPAWLAASREAWEVAWADPVSKAWTSADRPILLRWIDAYDRSVRLLGRADKAPTTRGSMGQLVESPFYGTAFKSITVAERCEAQLGFGALNRERLGFALAEARKSLRELNADLAEAVANERDPRAG